MSQRAAAGLCLKPDTSAARYDLSPHFTASESDQRRKTLLLKLKGGIYFGVLRMCFF